MILDHLLRHQLLLLLVLSLQAHAESLRDLRVRIGCRLRPLPVVVLHRVVHWRMQASVDQLSRSLLLGLVAPDLLVKLIHYLLFIYYLC